jgi:cytoskeleton protein RodZ
MALMQRLKAPFAEETPARTAALPSGPCSAGDVLRQQRKALGVDVADVAAALRIKPAYIAALEAGRPDQLPGHTYAIGFMRTYADYLGLESDEVLRRFKQESTAFDRKPDLSFPMPLGERSVPDVGMLLVALILALCGYGTWYYLSTGESSRPARVAEVPAELLPPKPEQRPQNLTVPHSIEALAAPPVTAPAEDPPAPSDTASAASAPAGLSTTSAIPTSSRALTAPAAAPGLPPNALEDVSQTAAIAGPPQSTSRTADASTRIVIRAIADSWVRIRDAGQSILLGRELKAGESYDVPDRPGLSMRTGNAGGLSITVDGNPAPPIGRMGAVRNVALEPQALMAGAAARE